jgi:hypothetical protein
LARVAAVVWGWGLAVMLLAGSAECFVRVSVYMLYHLPLPVLLNTNAHTCGGC